MVGIVGGVGKHGGGTIFAKQGGGLWDVAALTGRDDDPGRAAKAADGQMDLGAQAATRSAKGMIFRPFFAPAAC